MEGLPTPTSARSAGDVAADDGYNAAATDGSLSQHVAVDSNFDCGLVFRQCNCNLYDLIAEYRRLDSLKHDNRMVEDSNAIQMVNVATVPDKPKHLKRKKNELSINRNTTGQR
uniref:Uncharacterized protein n=1 Tax=Parascaris univalens TaxID=6257 RepID=A0A915A1Z7_PARUN